MCGCRGTAASMVVVTMKDATCALYSAFLVHEEGAASSFRGLREVVADRGPSCSL